VEKTDERRSVGVSDCADYVGRGFLVGMALRGANHQIEAYTAARMMSSCGEMAPTKGVPAEDDPDLSVGEQRGRQPRVSRLPASRSDVGYCEEPSMSSGTATLADIAAMTGVLAIACTKVSDGRADKALWPGASRPGPAPRAVGGLPDA
jgi:hypothetical protein